MATYWGYDTFACPSSKELKGTFNSGCSFIGYYLAPTLNKHRTNTSFMGKRNAIINSGLNPVAIYMGSQPSDSGVNASLGTKEANDAATKASSEGFNTGSYIYLDIEIPCDTSYKDYHSYVRAWVVQINIRGYKAGIYVTSSHPYSGSHSTSSTAPNVSLSGVSYATIWQCVQNENHSFSSDICLLVDLNSSTVKNPGA